MTAGKKDGTKDRQVRRDAFRKLGLILLAVLFAVNTIQLARFGEVVERVDLYNKGVIDELGGIRQDVVTFGNDLNEIRRFLLLPAREYSFMKGTSETQDVEEKKTTRTETALYSFLSEITDEQARLENAKLAETRVSALAGDAAFAAELEKNGLKTGKLENGVEAVSFKISDNEGDNLFAFLIEKDSNKPKVQSALGLYEVLSQDEQSMKSELINFFKKNKDEALRLKNLISGQKKAIESFTSNKDLAAVLKDKKTQLSAPEEADESVNYYLVNAGGDKLLTIQIGRKDGMLSFEDKTYKTGEELMPLFMEKAKTVDASSAQEKLIKDRRFELEGIFSQPAFQDILKNDGLAVSLSPREEYNKLLYDVKDADGKLVFSFAIELSSGMFKVIRGNQEIDLYSALNNGSKKKP